MTNDFTNNESLTEQHFIGIALEYATAMNAIERDINRQSDAAPEADFFPQFQLHYRPIFEAYTTSKRRVYGGQAAS